jgi:hypothetical protein
MHRCFCCGPQTVRLALCLTACAALFAAAGCGGKPYSCVHVSGKITYEDGSLIPADQIHLIFLSQAKPIDPKTPPKNGLADANGKTGEFDFATTYASRDGIIAGEHKVVVQCISNGLQRRDLLPPEYGAKDKTPLKVRTSDLSLVMKVPKPRRPAGLANR